MKTISKKPHRNSARTSLNPISFYCAAPDAKFVSITGDFNQWTRLGMVRRADGWWYVQMSLCHGHYQYRFIVDGKPMLDRFAAGIGRDERGREVSLVWVS